MLTVENLISICNHTDPPLHPLPVHLLSPFLSANNYSVLCKIFYFDCLDHVCLVIFFPYSSNNTSFKIYLRLTICKIRAEWSLLFPKWISMVLVLRRHQVQTMCYWEINLLLMQATHFLKDRLDFKGQIMNPNAQWNYLGIIHKFTLWLLLASTYWVFIPNGSDAPLQPIFKGPLLKLFKYTLHK